MPRVKIDYVVSMSSEDPENPANNLLAWDVSKKKWLCKMGETSCSVVLQLAKAIQVESITVGTYHTSLLEVLVGSSEKPNNTFEVLVPSCVLCTPREARGAAVERVRSFTRDALSAAHHRRWDRLRVVCSQPYNRHCQYGLSFVHVFEREDESRALRLDALGSDDEDFRPGELFRQHELDKRRPDDIEAQIESVTTQTSHNRHDFATKIMKTPIAKTKTEERERSPGCLRRDKRSLVYTDDDEGPHDKVDKVVRRHNEWKRKHEDMKKGTRNNPTADNVGEDGSRPKREIQTDDGTMGGKDTTSSGTSKKRRREEEASEPARRGRALLANVVFTISGYVNPRRAAVRAAAIRMGARYTPDVTDDCTHLICAFPDTPKLRRCPPGVRVVTADWVERCERSGRLERNDPRFAHDTYNAQQSDDTDDDDVEQRNEEIDDDKSLPRFLEGATFAVSEAVRGAERELVTRYIAAYGGILVQASCESPQYVLSPSTPCSPSWLWECHARKRLLPLPNEH